MKADMQMQLNRVNEVLIASKKMSLFIYLEGYLA